MISRQDLTSSSSPNASSLDPASASLKPITAQPSNAGSEHHANSPAVRLVVLMLRGYKLLISPYFRGSCRFLPSCADYAAMAVAERGALQGGWLALCRLARCH